MNKPAVSPAVLRLGVSLLGVTVAAIGTVLNGVEFSSLVEGGADAWKKLGVALVVAIGGGIYGWTRKWFADFSFEELPLEWRESLAPEPIKPTTNDVDVDIAK